MDVKRMDAAVADAARSTTAANARSDACGVTHTCTPGYSSPSADAGCVLHRLSRYCHKSINRCKVDGQIQLIDLSDAVTVLYQWSLYKTGSQTSNINMPLLEARLRLSVHAAA
jgi:hypothetical protein